MDAVCILQTGYKARDGQGCSLAYPVTKLMRLVFPLQFQTRVFFFFCQCTLAAVLYLLHKSMPVCIRADVPSTCHLWLVTPCTQESRHPASLGSYSSCSLHHITVLLRNSFYLNATWKWPNQFRMPNEGTPKWPCIQTAFTMELQEAHAVCNAYLSIALHCIA